MKNSKTYTKEELEGFTIAGREGEPSLTDIAKANEVDPTMNKDKIIAEVLKAQGAPKESVNEKGDSDNSAAAETEPATADASGNQMSQSLKTPDEDKPNGDPTAPATTDEGNPPKDAATDATKKIEELDAVQNKTVELIDELKEKASTPDPTVLQRDPGAKAVVTGDGEVEMRDRHIPPPNRPSAVELERQRQVVNEVTNSINETL